MFIKKRNDQVFSLSITEIALILVFILVLFIGLNPELNQIEENKKAITEAEEKIRSTLSNTGVSNPDEVLSDLRKKVYKQVENETLKQEVNNLKSQLTTLTEIKSAIGKESNKENLVHTEVMEAMAVKKQIEEIMGKENIKEDNRQDVLKKFGDFLKNNPSNEKDIKDLKGQVAFLQNRLNAHGGRDYPPCWVEEKSGKIQFLFDIAITDDGLTVKKAWPSAREDDAINLPGINKFLSDVTFQTLSNFKKDASPIYQWSHTRDPECRHYVYITNMATNALFADRLRLGVEDFFYKQEHRR